MVNELKWKYNHNLNRFYNGCNYIAEHPENVDKYLKEVMKIKENMDKILEEIMQKEIVTEKQILNGF